MAASKKPFIKNRDLRRFSHQMRMLAKGLDAAAVERLQRRRLVFTLTNGRSGSMVLYSLFEQLEGAEAAHEPDPRLDFHRVRAARDPAYARRVIERLKLPVLARGDRRLYVETNHLIAKAYTEALEGAADAHGLDLSYIVLTRPPREIAKSMLRLNTAPGRSKLARLFYTDPRETCLLQIPDPDALTDYQLCYWHALETEARQGAYGARARAAGRRVARVALSDLNAPGGFEGLLDTLEITPTAADLARIEAFRGRTVNRKSWAPSDGRAMSEDEIEAQERALRRIVGLEV